ncbi:MAG: transposase [Candidatus Cloacimonetes bacterium]|nr:transposase [Candidatus Cloacimonadota bacterium]
MNSDIYMNQTQYEIYASQLDAGEYRCSVRQLADRGSSMKSKPVAFLLSDLGVTKSHSRPYISNDNPFSESHFKTMKYRPDFPERFNSMAGAREFCRLFFNWYNKETLPFRNWLSNTEICSLWLC